LSNATNRFFYGRKCMTEQTKCASKDVILTALSLCKGAREDYEQT